MTKPATENPLVNVRLVYSKDTWLNQQPTSHWPGQCSPIMAETTSAIKVRQETETAEVKGLKGHKVTVYGQVIEVVDKPQPARKKIKGISSRQWDNR